MKFDFEKLLATFKENKKLIKVIAMLLCFAIAFFVFITDKEDEEDMEISENQEIVNEDPAWDPLMPDSIVYIYVDVAGGVANPGVVKLQEGSRIFHAIAEAGGLSEDGDATPLNLAEPLSDGDKLYVPRMGEYDFEDLTGIGIITSNGSDGGTSSDNGKININKASSKELQTLSGIGNATAEKIIDYREKNGKFSAVEDLLYVSGIGEKLLAKIIEDICV